MSKPTANSNFTTKVKCYICDKEKFIWTRDYNPNIKYSCSKEHQSLITSNSLRGHPVTEETREKIKQKLIGCSRPEQVKNKIIKALIGRVVTEETREKIRKSNMGKTVPKEVGEKISMSKMGQQTGEDNPFFGKKHTDESRRKQSLAQGGTGIPYENHDYPEEFNDTLKESVRKRDDHKCQICSMTEEEHLIVIGTVLNVHHIDYNKLNNILLNLISLCKQCHTRTNHNREHWKKFFEIKIVTESKAT